MKILILFLIILFSPSLVEAGGIGKGLEKIIRKKEEKEIKKKIRETYPPVPPVLEVEASIPGILIEGRPPPPGTYINIKMKEGNKEIPFPTEGLFWFEMDKIGDKILKYTKKNPYFIKAGIKGIELSGDEVIDPSKLSGGQEEKFYLEKNVLTLIISLKR